MTTVLGLALAIDYSLLVLTRFREERTRARTLDDAIIERFEPQAHGRILCH